MEVFSIASLVLQAFVVSLSLIAYGYVADKYAWKWFVLASLMVFIRRVTGSLEILLEINTDPIEDVETVMISIMWILFICIRCRGFRKRDDNQISF